MSDAEVLCSFMPEMREFAPGYHVTADGRVFCTNPRSGRGAQTAPREIAQTVNHRGYANVAISVAGKPRYWRVNRAVASAWIGPAPSDRHEAAHLNGKRLDNRRENLAWKTPKANCADRKAHGTQAPPATQILSIEQARQIIDLAVLKIRGHRAEVKNRRDLAIRFGVSNMTVRAIVHGSTWPQLADERAAKLKPITQLRQSVIEHKGKLSIRRCAAKFGIGDETVKRLWGMRK